MYKRAEQSVRFVLQKQVVVLIADSLLVMNKIIYVYIFQEAIKYSLILPASLEK